MILLISEILSQKNKIESNFYSMKKLFNLSKGLFIKPIINNLHEEIKNNYWLIPHFFKEETGKNVAGKGLEKFCKKCNKFYEQVTLFLSKNKDLSFERSKEYFSNLKIFK